MRIQTKIMKNELINGPADESVVVDCVEVEEGLVDDCVEVEEEGFVDWEVEDEITVVVGAGVGKSISNHAAIAGKLSPFHFILLSASRRLNACSSCVIKFAASTRSRMVLNLLKCSSERM